MKKTIPLFIALCACFFSLQSFSQQSKIDSLLQVLKTAKEDTAKANTLNSLGIEYVLAGDPDAAKKYCREAELLSEKLHFEKGKAKAFNTCGTIYQNEGNYPEATKNFSDALSIGEKIKDHKIIARSCNGMGNVYFSQGKYPEATKLHHQALQNYKAIFDSSGMAKSYNNLGIIYEEVGNYTESTKSFFASLKIAEARGDKEGIANAYSNMAGVYYNQKLFADAIKRYSSALKLFQEMGDNEGIGVSYIGLGTVYLTMDSLEPALNFCRKGFEILEAQGNKAYAAMAKITIADINTKLGNYAQALDDFSVTLKLFNEMDDKRNVSSSYRGIGEVYFQKGQYDEALKNFNTALEIAKSIDYKPNIREMYRLIATAYEKKKDYKNAYLNHQLYYMGSDSMLNESKSKQITEMQTRFETEKKDNDIALLSKDKEIQEVEIKKQKLQKYSFIGGSGVVIVLLLFGYRNYRIRQALRLQDIRNKIAGDLHDDIGSTLNSISVYSEVARRKDEEHDEALQMIGEASRKIIDAMSDIVWTVNPDNDSFAKILFRMKSLAYNLFRAKKIEYSFHADEKLDEKKLRLEDRRNFYLIFKEAVNNLVKYSNATQATITLTNENDFIRLLIRDNGVGFDTSQDAIGNGLKNMKQRAEEMQAQLKIESSKGNGTQIELILKA